ncbi:recombinase family protein [Tsukamurella pulmonis]|uniref:recombinase family protein n=1 Tax=Tsukamurella pulmonis TaxID=47312 RepID=UPI000E09D3AB|nr:recombinase family protein [Tsukamurella pulmonis]RDH13762.1 recombinase family protein [Tsukamurella pulmonis]
MKLIGYLRVSTIEQAEHGFGLDAQRAAIKAAAKAAGHRVVSWTTDEGLSGAKPAEARPGLTEALDAIAAGEADGLIVRDLDRLARSVTVQEAVLASLWQKPGVEVFTSTGAVPRDDPDDPMRTAYREMTAVFAGLERRMISKRLRDGRNAKAAKGGWAAGRTPYGYHSEKKGQRSVGNEHGALVETAAEQLALARMLRLSAEGRSSRQIAAVLTAEGVPTKRGGRWQSATITRILARQAYPSGPD